MIVVLLTAVLAAAPPELAVLSSRGDGASSELRFQRAGAELAAPAVTFSHVRRSTVLGALLPGTRTVLAVAQTADARDPSFAAALIRLEPGSEASTLAEGLALASRPLVTRTGRIFVQRATVDEVNLRTGALRTVYPGFAWLAGELDSELLLYRVGTDGAELIAVHEDAPAVRTLAHIAPFARDFVLDGHTLFFTQVDGERGQVQHPLTQVNGERWQVLRLDLRTLELSSVVRGVENLALLPAVFPQGLAFNPGAGTGLRLVNGSPALAPQGPGFDRVRFVRGGWAVGLHEAPSDFPTAFAVELKSGRSLKVAAPAQSRLDLAGIVE